MAIDVVINLVLTVAGIVMLCYGGNWLVNGGVAIAKRFHISNIVIGMTVIAYGTSTPELAASIAAAGEHSEIILGNIIGSNIANIGMVIGVTAIMIPLLAKKTTLKKDVPIMLGFSLLLIILSLDGKISQYDGLLLIVLLMLFTVYMYRTARTKSEQENNDIEFNTKNSNLRALGLMGVGIILLYFGAELTVDNAVAIAQTFGISERIIGLTVIAIGTSLPELITSIIAIKKDHTDIGIGNIIGSNVYNILMIMGVASVLTGIVVSDQTFYDYAIMMGFSVGLLIAMMTGIVTRKIGFAFVASYVIYLVSGFLLN
ncbi:MAG: calcium/sodium antiporter [Nitrosarchaeum sp.]|nr:calcium/sodium antiporter [Nitrosarchaeum sp.]